MNYRHIYHAGNFADIVKHLVLIAALQELCKKDKPFAVLDAFAGIGLYDLLSPEALKTNESTSGVGSLLQDAKGNKQNVPQLVQKLTEIIAIVNEHFLSNANDIIKLYPGSPLIINNLLRQQDRLIACELHLDDYLELKKVVFTGAHNIDAYQAVKAFLPFPENRGLVFLDPPFEVQNEFAKLINALTLIKKRAANICTVIWYPIKNRNEVEGFYKAYKAIGFKEALKLEFVLNDSKILDTAPDPKKVTPPLKKTGLLIVNPPNMKQELEDALRYLVKEIYSSEAVYNLAKL